jgi:hypothetical protein
VCSLLLTLRIASGARSNSGLFEFTRLVLAQNRMPEPQPRLSTTITNTNTNEHQYNTIGHESIYLKNSIPVRMIVSTSSDSIQLRIHIPLYFCYCHCHTKRRVVRYILLRSRMIGPFWGRQSLSSERGGGCIYMHASRSKCTRTVSILPVTQFDILGKFPDA